MFIMLKALLISSVTMIVRTGRAIWLNPFATGFCSVCSAVTVEGYGLILGKLVYVFVGFWDRDYISQPPYVSNFVVKSSFKHIRDASQRVPMCFRCPMFNFFMTLRSIFVLFYFRLDLSCGEYNFKISCNSPPIP